MIYSNKNKINQFGTLWKVKLFISHVWWFSSLYLRCTTDYQYSDQYSYEYLSTCPWVRVQILLLWNSRSKVPMPEVQCSSTVNMSTEYEYHSPGPKLLPKLIATFIINWTLSNRVEFEAKTYNWNGLAPIRIGKSASTAMTRGTWNVHMNSENVFKNG